MAHQVVVRLKDKHEIYGPETSKEEADEALAKIKAVLSSVRDPGLDWLAVQGRAVLSAHIIERADEPTGASWSD